jgi:glutathione-specific gamma-glutamylcyclotransferase
MQADRQMALTADLVASLAQVIVDAGPVPGTAEMNHDDYAALIENTLTQVSSTGLWFFAYGSLLWDPACETVESRRAVVHGWHRSFCFWVKRGRGTLDKPGLMMALDRGGQCHGMVFRIHPSEHHESLGKLMRREIITKPWINLPRWLPTRTPEGPVKALGFVVNREESRYAGRLELDHIADILSVAVGHRGSGAEYLRNTVSHLEQIGIQDRNLWCLQNLVAERIRSRDRSS